MNLTEGYKLAIALKKANKAAYDVVGYEDGGTCNFDCALIKLPKLTTEEEKIIGDLSGVNIKDKSYGIWKQYRFVRTVSHGQAAMRTRMAEATRDSLKEDGYDCAMYYQMD